MESLLHPLTIRWLSQAATTPSGAYLFHGNSGTGKATAARELADILNRDAPNYPYLTVVTLEDKASIGIEQIRKLQNDLSLRTANPKGQRVILIDAAEKLTTEAQNALLKVIEEPPEATIIILAATDPERLLPTVRSRTQAVYFPPLATPIVADYLVQHEGIPSAMALELARLSGGAVGLARRLATDETELETYRRLDTLGLELLEAPVFTRLVTAKQLAEAKAPLGILVGRIQYRLQEALRDGSSDGGLQLSRLEAIVRFWRRLEANVTPRLALESLLLEI
jgi:DNA polymerase-3 subunit delta'